MLYRELIEQKFTATAAPAVAQEAPARPAVDSTGGRSTRSSALLLAASVAGNMLIGSVFLGALLMAPLWLQGLLKPLL